MIRAALIALAILFSLGFAPLAQADPGDDVTVFTVVWGT